jgi:hypothetical protein
MAVEQAPLCCGGVQGSVVGCCFRLAFVSLVASYLTTLKTDLYLDHKPVFCRLERAAFSPALLAGALLALAGAPSSTLAQPVKPAYVRSSVGALWDGSGGAAANNAALNQAFGAGQWDDLRYESVNVSNLFAANRRFVYLEGSDGCATVLASFLATNRLGVSNWVNGGGTLWLNAAPTEGNGMDLGFGVALNYINTNSWTCCQTGVVAAVQHPIFRGPSAPVGTVWSGTYFGRALLSGSGLTALITNAQNGGIVLAEKASGAGRILCGGLTTPNFHLPQPEAANLRANLLAYGAAGPPTNGVFAASAPIIIPTQGPATNYPSSNVVAGLTGTIIKVTVTLSNLNHSWPDDLDILLVGPSGSNVMLMSDCGGSAPLANVTLTFSDEAAGALADGTSIAPRTYRPTNYSPSDSPAAPAPAGPFGTNLAVFSGTDPNGLWKLFVFDDSAGSGGGISNGWSLQITTVVGPSVTPAVHHFVWGLVGTPQTVNAPFGVTLSAQDASNQTLTNFTGALPLTASADGNLTTIPIIPPVSGAFVNGTWSGTIVVPQAATNLVLQADDGSGHSGLSNPFVVEAPPTISILPPVLSAEQIELRFATQTGVTYHAQWADQLQPSGTLWHDLQTVPGDGTVQMVTDATTPADQRLQRFYRVVAQ